MDYRESLEVALAREVKEECNIEIGELSYFCSFANTYRYEEVTYFSCDAFFVCRPLLVESLAVSEENSEYRIVDLDDFDLDQVGFESIRAALERYKTVGRH